MKKILYLILIIAVLAFSSNAFAVTYYFKTAGVNNNWSNGANWCDQTNGAGSCGTAPTASIDAVLDSNSGAVDIDTTSCVAKTLVCTGYTGTLTFTATKELGVSGSVTFDDSMTLAGTGKLSLKAEGTLTMDGETFPGDINITSSGTYTLGGTLAITGTFRIGTTAAVLAGAYDITCAIFILASQSAATNLTLVVAQTLTVTTSFIAMQVPVTSYLSTIKSSSAGNDTIIVYQGTAANCKVAGIVFTDVHADGSAQAIDDWYGSITGTTTGVNVRTSADIGGGGGAWGF